MTRRERAVLRLMMLGRTGVEIADELKLAVPTVKSHRRAFFRGLNARNQIELVTRINRWALDRQDVELARLRLQLQEITSKSRRPSS